MKCHLLDISYVIRENRFTGLDIFSFDSKGNQQFQLIN